MMTSILVLPTPVLLQISEFWTGDELYNLFLAGNHSLNLKLSRISQITVKWNASAFCDWNACLPFIKRFPKMNSLLLTTGLPIQRTQRQMEWSRLSTNLSSLSLQFCDSFELLLDGEPFLELPSLTYLSVSETDPAEITTVVNNSTYTPTIVLGQFPPNLQHLFISTCRPANCHCQVSDLDLLPPGLISFDVNIPVSWNPNSSTSKLLKFGVQDVPPTLTHLGIRLSSYKNLDIQRVGPTLKYLRLYEGNLFFAEKPIARMTSREGPPLRSLFPHLHTLILPPKIGKYLPWHVFETLPLSITRLEGPFDLRNRPSAESTDVCRQLNLEHSRIGHGTDDARPGAPRMIRHFAVTSDYEDDMNFFWEFFPLLEKISCPHTYRTSFFHYLPKNLRFLHMPSMDGVVSHLPTSLTSIRCDRIRLTRDAWQLAASLLPNASAEMKSKVVLPRLVTFSMLGHSLSVELISMLPNTLENLEVVIMDMDTLAAFANFWSEAAMLPHLTSLVVQVPTNDNQSPTFSPLMMSIEVLPATLRELTIRGTCEFPSGLSQESLRNHSRLTSLSLAEPLPPKDIFAQLPPQLLRLSCALASPVDLNDVEALGMLSTLPHHLRSLQLSLPTQENWFIPINRSSLRHLPLSIIDDSIAYRFKTLRALPGSLISESMLFAASGCLAASALPRSLSEFLAPWNAGKGHLIPTTLLQLFTERMWMDSWKDVLKHLLIYRVPLIGAIIPNQYHLSSQSGTAWSSPVLHAIALPPNLSRFEPLHNDFKRAYTTSRAVNHASEYQTRDRRLNRYFTRSAFQLMNIIVSCVGLNLIIGDHPVPRALSWISIIGSLVYMLRIPNGVGHLPIASKGLSSALGLLFFPGIPLMVTMSLSSYAFAVALGFSRTPWSVPSRVLSFGLGSILEFGIYFFTKKVSFEGNPL